MEEMIEILRERFGSDEPIFTYNVISLFEDMPARTVFFNLRRAVEEGALAKAGRGVYYLPSDTVLGKSVLSPLQSLTKKYIADGKDVFGYWGGLMLENQEGLTTQNPTVLEIVTNKATKPLTRLGSMGGYREVILRQPRIPIEPENVETLKFLDLVTSANDDEATDALAKLAGALNWETVRNAIRFYPAKTSKRLIESGLVDVLARRRPPTASRKQKGCSGN